ANIESKNSVRSRHTLPTPRRRPSWAAWIARRPGEFSLATRGSGWCTALAGGVWRSAKTNLTGTSPIDAREKGMMPAMLATAGHPDDGELDPGLLARCQAGEPAALRAFVEHYQRAVFALLSRIVGQL